MNFFFILIFSLLISLVDNFKINSKINSKKIPIKASLDGIELGLLTLGSGLLLDNTISKPSLDNLKQNNITLYNQGMTKVYRNLLFLGPVYYLGVDKFIINDHTSPISLYQTMGIVLVHSFGYYFAHRSMHRNDFFKKYHYFHHQFNETLVPSIGNAVSENEFTFAYMFPFVVGSLMVDPNINSFNMGIMIVSIFNLIIHCQELENIKWNQYFVSPKVHLYHHQSKNQFSAYSAPTFNLENIGRKLKELFNKLS